MRAILTNDVVRNDTVLAVAGAPVTVFAVAEGGDNGDDLVVTDGGTALRVSPYGWVGV